jgi:nicotinamidase-related amidase
MKPALLLIDIQNDYFPGGAMEVVGSPEAAAKASMLLATFREQRLPVIHVQHVSTRPGATFFVPGTPGVDIHESVAPQSDEFLVKKHFPNSFRDTHLLAHLQSQGIKQLVIAGMMTHMCVDSTTRAAADLGFECLLAHDGCATRSLSFGGVNIPAASVHTAFLAALNGLFAKIKSAEDIRAKL